MRINWSTLPPRWLNWATYVLETKFVSGKQKWFDMRQKKKIVSQACIFCFSSSLLNWIQKLKIQTKFKHTVRFTRHACYSLFYKIRSELDFTPYRLFRKVKQVASSVNNFVVCIQT